MVTEKLEAGKSTPLLNSEIKKFFLKLFILVIIWECGYHYILEPARVPDKQLTNVITSSVANCINLFSPPSSVYTWSSNPVVGEDYIVKNGKVVFIIVDSCNGLSLLVIYLGFIILMPYPLKRKIAFSIGGIIILTIANIIRCVLLYWIYRTHPAMFEFNHHYLFSILMYLLIFYGWILFTKGGKFNEAG